jgi:hypothetical protein
MERNYDHQPCIVYGGGSKMPRLGNGLIRIFDNGSLSLLVTECTLEKKQIEDFQVISNIEFEDRLWMNDLTLLVVALGLSFIQSDASSGWIDLSDYKRDDSGAAWVPHPVNEGYYIYDVLRSKWA